MTFMNNFVSRELSQMQKFLNYISVCKMIIVKKLYFSMLIFMVAFSNVGAFNLSFFSVVMTVDVACDVNLTLVEFVLFVQWRNIIASCISFKKFFTSLYKSPVILSCNHLIC